MATHYNAFISYRHCTVDSEVARRIHRQLERIRIPAAIRKATGIRKIDRVFRDKEELPLSVNLTDDIGEALRNSDYLIVICSPRFQQSLWCMREIELFLQTHPVERVLIVLAEGEPDDVVPPILTRDREPLCCDYRMKPRRAKAIELPRLVSAILGCRYDDLRQRQRQYRARRLTALVSAVVAASLALAGYFFKTSQQIQRNYEQALRNQSQFLSAQSLQLLESGDRLSAIALALEALPSAEMDRPWVADAEYALVQASSAYTSDYTVQAVNAFTHPGMVSGFFVSPDGYHLVSWDDTNKVYVWKTDTFSLLHTIDPRLVFADRDVIPVGESLFLVAAGNGVSCFDYLEGTCRWEKKGIAGTNALLLPDHKTLVLPGTTALTLLDAYTGETVRTIELPELLDGAAAGTFVFPLTASPDGRTLALRYPLSDGTRRLLLLDLENGETLLPGAQFGAIGAACFCSGGELVLASSGEVVSGSGEILHGQAVFMQAQVYTLTCLDGVTGQVKWSTEVEYYMPDYGAAMHNTVLPDGRQVLCFSCANVCQILAVEDGTPIQRLEMPSSAVTCEPSGTYLYWYLRDGQMCTYRLGDNKTSSIKYFSEGAERGLTNHGFYILPDFSERIVLYRSDRDDSWQTVGGEAAMGTIRSWASEGNYAVILDWKNDLWCYDLEADALCWQTHLQPESYHLQMLGISGDQLVLLNSEASPGTLDSYSLRDGSCRSEQLVLEKQEGYESAERSGAAVCSGGWAFYAVRSYSLQISPDGGVGSVGCSHVCAVNLTTGEMRRFELPLEKVTQLIPDQTGSLVAVMGLRDGADDAVLLKTENGEISQLPCVPGQVGNSAVLTWSNEYFFVYGTDRMIHIADSQGAHETIHCGVLEPQVMRFDPQERQLLVLFTNGELHSYDLQGVRRGQTRIYFYEGSLTGANVSWELGNEDIFVTVDKVCSVVDRESFSVYSYVPGSRLYHPEKDRFYLTVSGQDGYQLAWYARYSLSALVDRAGRILGENTLTQEQREQYGLE